LWIKKNVTPVQSYICRANIDTIFLLCKYPDCFFIYEFEI
jgi:hypothetical protein